MLLGNNKPRKIQGIGSIRLKLHDGIEKIIKDVRFVPNHKRNLILLGELDKKGYLFRGENDILEVMKDSRIITRGVRKHDLYSLEGKVVAGLIASGFVRDMSRIELWHRRLGHVSERGLVELSKQGMLCGDKVEKLNFCEHCVYGKTCKAKFGVGQQRTKGILDLIHADLWGPSRTLSHSQN